MTPFLKRHLAKTAAIGLAFILFHLAGCGSSKTLVMYEGEQRPEEQTATIDISSRSLYLMGIDTLVNRYQALTASSIEVLPGEHTLIVNYKSWKGRSAEPVRLSFTALAGHTYKVKVSGGYRRWTVWIVDLTDESVVAGSPRLREYLSR